MQKSFLLSLLGLLLLSCQTQEIQKEEPALGDANGFLAVRIMTDDPATRADNDGKGTYKDGTEAENAIGQVLFFFFDDKGNANAIRNEEENEVSWYLCNPGNASSGSDSKETVEKSVSIIPISFSAEKSNLPKQVLTVVNPTSSLLDKVKTMTPGPGLSDLLEIVDDYEGIDEKGVQTLAKEGRFVMSNSVYYDGTAAVKTTQLSEDNYYTSKELDALESEEAKNEFISKKTVRIYVERVLARLDLRIALTNEPITITKDDGNITVYQITPKTTLDGKSTDIYVHFLGWNITSTPKKSRLIKEIDEKWTDKGLFGDNGLLWNTKDYHRSFWAINPKLDESDYRFGPLIGLEGNNGHVTESELTAADRLPLKDEYTTAYMQENAAPADPGEYPTDNTDNYIPGAPVQPTKVIIAAQFVDAKGEAIEMAEWGGNKYTYDGLMMVIAHHLSNNGKMYKRESEEKYRPIGPDDLDLSSTDGSDVQIVLKNEEGWYTIETKTPTPDQIEGIDDPNGFIKEKIGPVSFWTKGYTYFYFTVRHLGEEKTPGEFGIVRNHIYETTVKSISGFGTPVYDPGNDIVPEPPKEQFLLAADVRILSWRLVHQDYDLTW